jgi:hypothetical protein
MSTSDFVFGAMLLGLVGFQVWLTRKVWISQMFDRQQKMRQSQLIWLVPLVGAVLVFSLMPEDDTPRKPSSSLRG